MFTNENYIIFKLIARISYYTIYKRVGVKKELWKSNYYFFFLHFIHIKCFQFFFLFISQMKTITCASNNNINGQFIQWVAGGKWLIYWSNKMLRYDVYTDKRSDFMKCLTFTMGFFQLNYFLANYISWN